MRIEVEQIDGQPVIKLEGEVDLSSSPQLREEIQRQLKKEPSFLVIELSRVEYMDSSGVATLVEALKKLGRFGGKLRLVSPTEAVSQVLHFVHLDKVFEIFPTVAEATAR